MGFLATRRARSSKPTRIPLHLIFLIFASLLALWLIALPIYDVFLERSVAVDPDATFIDSAIDGEQPHSPTSNLAHLSDLEVAKASKTQADADRAARDAAPRFDRDYCELHFGLKWLQDWNTTIHTKCSPHQYSKVAHRTIVQCRSVHDTHMPNASAPHIMCDATNLTIVPSSMTRASCPHYRPGYMCRRHSYHHYARGAFLVPCEWPSFRLDDFSRDHLMDIFSGFEMIAEDGIVPSPMAVVDVPVLLVTREAQEYNNVFHTMTDVLNAYITLRMLGWESGPRVVVLLDAHPPGPLDGLWGGVVAGGGREGAKDPWGATTAGGQMLLQRVDDLPSPTLVRHAAFVPPGYASLLFAFLYQDNECPIRTSLFKSFRAWALDALDIVPPLPVTIDLNAPLKVMLISRRPYQRHRKVSRRMSNEREVVTVLRGVPGVVVDLVDLTSVSLVQQISLVAKTDILIGMHGAALTYSLLQPPYGGLLELWPQVDGMWRCFEHTAEWSGLLYRRWANADTRRHQEGIDGDTTTVDVEEVKELFVEMVGKVRKRKAAYGKEGENGGQVHAFLVRR